MFKRANAPNRKNKCKHDESGTGYWGKTKSQSKSGLWYQIKSCTASHIGEIAKRQLKIDDAVEIVNDEIIAKERKLTYSLLSRLNSTKSFQSAAMIEGFIKEPLAAKKYSSIRILHQLV